MVDLMRQIMSGQVSPVMVSAIIVGLRVKKETIGEINRRGSGDARTRDPVTVKDPDNLVDIVGTGGTARTPSISRPLPCSFAPRRGPGRQARQPGRVFAVGQRGRAGGPGREHQPEARAVGRCIDEVGVGFMFAPAHHAAMKHAAAR